MRAGKGEARRRLTATAAAAAAFFMAAAVIPLLPLAAPVGRYASIRIVHETMHKTIHRTMHRRTMHEDDAPNGPALDGAARLAAPPFGELAGRLVPRAAATCRR